MTPTEAEHPPAQIVALFPGLREALGKPPGTQAIELLEHAQRLTSTGEPIQLGALLLVPRPRTAVDDDGEQWYDAGELAFCRNEDGSWYMATATADAPTLPELVGNFLRKAAALAIAVAPGERVR